MKLMSWRWKPGETNRQDPHAFGAGCPAGPRRACPRGTGSRVEGARRRRRSLLRAARTQRPIYGAAGETARPGRSSSQAIELIRQPSGVRMNCVEIAPRTSIA
jgi:hypothetical protein